MGAAARGVAQEEDNKQGIDEPDIFDGVVFFLPAITRLLFNRVLGADDALFRPVMGKRGEAGAAAETGATGAGSSSSGTTPVAASASETPRRSGNGRGIAQGAQGREQHGQEHVNPLIRFTLAHPEQAPLHHLERRGLQIRKDEEQSIFRGLSAATRSSGLIARHNL